MTYLEDLHQYEDTEQALAVSETTIDLPYNPETGTILAGPQRGLNVDEMADALSHFYRSCGHLVRPAQIHTRPWWRLFKPTPTHRLTIRNAYTLDQVTR